jgi:2-oxoglutarate ferredoxin oxidoreductase subunit beta
VKGFRFIEAVSQCPTAFGRRAGFKDAGQMLKWFRESAISIEEAEKLSEEELNGKIIIGEFIKRKKPTLNENIYKTIEEAKTENGEN